MADRDHNHSRCERVSLRPGDVSLPPTPALQNSLKCSRTGKFVSILCDFGTVQILKLKVSSDDTSTAETVKILTFGKDETLVGHSWSTGDDVLAVAGQKVYLFQVSQEFALIHTFELYFHPNDVSVSTLHEDRPNGKLHAMHQVAIAGPNGVEISMLEQSGSTFCVSELVPLHPDLAISLVLFSGDGLYLAVAALDCHFGIWNVSSLRTDRKEFWFVLLDTVRITGVAFSPDSSLVAVSCWDASVHLYEKVRGSNSFTWMETQLNTNSKPSKISEAMPGTFVCWSADSRMFMQSLWSGVGSSVSIIDVYSRQEYHHQDLLLLAQDAVKGIDSFRQQSGSNHILCFSRTKKLLLLKWPGAIKRNAISCATSDLQPTQEILLKQSLLGAVWLVSGAGQSVILRWRPSKERVREKLEAFESVAFSSSGRAVGSPQSSSPKFEKCVGQDVEIGTGQSPVFQRRIDGVSETSKSGCPDGTVRASSSVFCECWADLPREIPDSAGSINGSYLINCRAQRRETRTAAESSDERSDCRNQRHERDSDLLNSAQHSAQREIKESISPSAASMQPFDELYAEEKQILKPTLNDTGAEANSETVLLATDTNGLTGAVKKANLSQNPCPKCGKAAPKQNPVDASVSVDVEAPFLSASSDEAPSIKHRPFSKSLFETGEAELLLSLEYLVVVVYPLLAHAYCRRTRKWTALVFCSPIIRCCLVAGRYLFSLKRDGTVELRSLERLMELLVSSSLVLKYVDQQRPLMVGAIFHAVVTLFDVDSAGRGEVLYLTFDNTEGEGPSITTQSLPVCFPLLSGADVTLASAHCMLGHLVLIKPSPNGRLPAAEGLKLSQNRRASSCSSTWTVLVSAINVAHNIPMDADYSVQRLFLEKYQDFYKLEALGHCTPV